MKEFDYITPIKDALDVEMHNICALFCTIGTPIESPRWFNFREKKEDRIMIGSTQRDALYFWVDAPYDVNIIEVTEFWKQFKAYRTNFLETNYKTIQTN